MPASTKKPKLHEAYPPTVLPEGASLQLRDAVRLLEHAHLIPPPHVVPGSAEWVQAVIDALTILSSRDPLTGLHNRRHFDLTLTKEIDRVARSGEAALMLLVDIDHFKVINDTHGHAVGDLVIQAVGQELTRSVRPMDVVARIGGEEFAVILPNCTDSFGRTVAERLRKRVASREIQIPHGEKILTSVSIGGAFAPPWVRSQASLWVERADHQMYRAKNNGRNRTEMETMVRAEVSAQEKGLLVRGARVGDLGDTL